MTTASAAPPDVGEDGAAAPRPSLLRLGSNVSLTSMTSGFSATLAEVDREKKPDSMPEGVVQGVARLSDRMCAAGEKLCRKPTEGLQLRGVAGLMRGSVEGVVYSSCEIHRGVCELAGSSIEGARGQADVIADRVFGAGRSKFKHGSESEGEGCLLESYRETDEEPQHFFQGVAIGGACIGKGFAEGLKALVEKPVERGQEEGFLGYWKGVGEGTKAISFKVAAGGLDLAASVVAGAKNTPRAVDKIRKDLLQNNSVDQVVGASPETLPQPTCPSVVGRPAGPDDEGRSQCPGSAVAPAEAWS